MSPPKFTKREYHYYYLAEVFSDRNFPSVTVEQFAQIKALMAATEIDRTVVQSLSSDVEVRRFAIDDPDKLIVSLRTSHLMVDSIRRLGFFMSKVYQGEAFSGAVAMVPQNFNEPIFLIGYPSSEYVAVLQPFEDEPDFSQKWSAKEAGEKLLNFIANDLPAYPIVENIQRSVSVPDRFVPYLDRIYTGSAMGGSLHDLSGQILRYEFRYGEGIGWAHIHPSPHGGYRITCQRRTEETVEGGSLTEAALNEFILRMRERVAMLGELPTF
ncbi:hypothetical protein [Stenotrophomonas sp. GD03657]|uniref:hypothetical protein n=1 Tax=Stenotrophomonas sp. GD03657 TaxID=2975363 RepID=UPI002449A673|nr:hypothetical protein [Stenotrophomonas sp. GD03657]MDH2154175.1 hypothetical protein [Stenotrophomonas sp. GD03657]